MKKILLHICCGPCTIYPYRRLKEEGWEVTLYWYNPNIHPYLEYQNRLMSAGFLAQRLRAELILGDYELEDFLKGAIKNIEESQDRCSFCYFLRLKKTSEKSKEKGFDHFTTTLLGSSQQKHNLIKETGEQMERDLGIHFYYEDFRKGERENREISRKMGLYRQRYCGCLFSEKERFG